MLTNIQNKNIAYKLGVALRTKLIFEAGQN